MEHDRELAAAALRGDPSALATLDDLMEGLRPALAQMRLAPDRIDELLDELRASLVTRVDGRPPRLASYQGRSQLRRWLRTVVVRRALDTVARPRDVALDEAMLDEVTAAHVRHDPTRDVAVRYRDELQSALAEALRALSERQRNALRLHIVDGLTLDQLANLYGVHRATVARWLAHTKQQVADATFAEIERRLGVEGSEAASLLRAVWSRLSLGGLAA